MNNSTEEFRIRCCIYDLLLDAVVSEVDETHSGEGRVELFGHAIDRFFCGRGRVVMQTC